MSILIDDLLSLSRVSRVPLRFEPVNISQLARLISDDLKKRNPARGVSVKISDGLRMNGHEQLIRIALENLLENAWKFTKKNPTANIEVGQQNNIDETTFFVSDNGAGFDMTYANRLFVPFQRLHSTSEFDGTGIGLATVHRIIARHGGRIWAQAEVGKGATFFFTFRDQK
jgi:light-regulated signal transduction histidine kinase (bacteriophytochrome)